jgi:hypothetical protein
VQDLLQSLTEQDLLLSLTDLNTITYRMWVEHRPRGVRSTTRSNFFSRLTDPLSVAIGHF